MRKFLPVALALMLLAAAHATRTQATADAGQKNAQQARAALDAMVQALGGPAWLNMKNQMRQGQVAAFDHGKPEPGTTEYWEFHAWPDHDRIEYTKHRDVVQFYLGRAGWEVTYKGKAPLPQEQVDDFCAAATTPSRPPSSSGSTTPAPSSSTRASAWPRATWPTR
jgi:hypothetical protein